jgi:hypothetical protein
VGAEFSMISFSGSFQLKTPSNFNPDALLLTDDDIEQFVKCKDLRGNVFQAFIRCMKFLWA